MAELALNLAIPRFKQNEDRMDRFVNGSNSSTWQTSGGDILPTLAKFLNDNQTFIDSATTTIYEARDEAVNAVSVVNFRIAQSRAAAIATTIPANIKLIQTQSFWDDSDRGGALYRRVATEPTHAGKFRSADRFLPNGGTDATNGGWWEIKEKLITPFMFGAIGDGVARPLSSKFGTLGAAQALYPHATALTDELDGVAIQTALSTNRTVFLHDANYRVNRALKFTAPYFQSLFGQSWDNCILTWLGTGFCILVNEQGGAKKEYFTIENFRIDAGNVANSNGIAVVETNHVTIRRVRFFDTHIGISVGKNATGSNCAIIRLEENFMRCANLTNGAGIELGYVGGLWCVRNQMQVRDSGSTTVVTVGNACDGIRLQLDSGRGNDTLIFRENLVERFDRGLIVSATGAGTQIINIWSDNNIFDTCKRNNGYWDATGGALIFGWHSLNDWFGGSDRPMYFAANTGGGMRDFSFVNPRAHMGMLDVVRGDGSALIGFRFINPSFHAAGGNGTANLAGLQWAGGEGLQVIGGVVEGNDSTGGFPTSYQGGVGIQISVDIGEYLIDGVRVKAATAGQEIVVPNHSLPSKLRRVVNCPGFSPAVSFPLPAASTTTYNRSPYVIDCYVHGGTMGGGMAKDAGPIPGMTQGMVQLQPGEGIWLGYTTAPSWAAFAHQ